jgi:hypothetical protein
MDHLLEWIGDLVCWIWDEVAAHRSMSGVPGATQHPEGCCVCGRSTVIAHGTLRQCSP